MSRASKFLDPTIARYIADVSIREPALAARLRAETAELSEANMQIATEQGQLMQVMVALSGARRCIEVGVFTGYSSLMTALALPDDGEIIACDVSAEWTDIGRKYWQEAGVAEKIQLHLQPALETLQGLLDAGQHNHFDFAFIDADKENYDGYFEACLALIRPGGLIMLDNMLWSGNVAVDAIDDADTVALRNLNLKLHQDERVVISLLPMADGITLAVKR